MIASSLPSPLSRLTTPTLRSPGAQSAAPATEESGPAEVFESSGAAPTTDSLASAERPAASALKSSGWKSALLAGFALVGAAGLSGCDAPPDPNAAPSAQVRMQDSRTHYDSDGTITAKIGRNTTFDSEGRVESRIGDKTTIRSDGTISTQVTPNMSIRSDGTITSRVSQHWSFRSDGTFEYHP